MLKDITLGQYYPTESVIHRLDPRVKLVATLMYIVSLFLFHDFVGFIVVTLFLIAIIRMYLVVGTSVMTLTTTPNKLTDGLEEGLKPLSKIGVPVHEIAMMMSIAMRFIPILAEEADKIKKAQMARGANFEEGNIIQKAKAMVPILVPLFVSAFRRANDLATAMEARCYHGGEGRTKMKPLHYISVDYKAYVVMVLYLAVVIVIRISI